MRANKRASVGTTTDRHGIPVLCYSSDEQQANERTNERTNVGTKRPQRQRPLLPVNRATTERGSRSGRHLRRRRLSGSSGGTWCSGEFPTKTRARSGNEPQGCSLTTHLSWVAAFHTRLHDRRAAKRTTDTEPEPEPEPWSRPC